MQVVTKMLIGIDLLWVRPKICGGTESVIRNLMNGFGKYDDKNEYLLFVCRDVADSFENYKSYSNMKIHICNTDLVMLRSSGRSEVPSAICS